MRPYEGLLTAMVTPFTSAGRVDEEKAVAVGRHLLAHGSDGLVVCGTTGEAPTLSSAEHLAMIALIAGEFADEVPVIAGTGSNDTAHAAEMTEQAIAAGVHAVLSVTPYYNKPSARGIELHFREVSKAAAGTPIVLYNIPGRTGTNMPPELLARLAQLDSVEAVKQSNADELQPIDGLAVLAGNDDLLARCLDMGGAGGVCVASHVAGDRMKALFHAEPAERAQLDAELRELYAALFCTNSPAPTKAALAMLGMDVGGTRLPIAPCDDAELALVRSALERAGLLAGATA
jgi:4-hydroxy-tetrahydrodipicolinate synthase